MTPVKLDLPSGLRIVTEELPHIHSISTGVYTKVGSRYETRQLNGVSHFLEHMFFKGTKRRNAREISEAIEGIGGILNAYTSFDTTVYYAKVADIHFELAVDVIADMLLHSSFDPGEIEKERNVIVEEIHSSLDQPADYVHQMLDVSMWGNQPLGWDIAGTDKSVGSIGREELLAYRTQHYTLPNTVISIAGNVSDARMADSWMKALADYPSGTVYQAKPTKSARPGPRLALKKKKTKQTNFCIGLSGISYMDVDRRALQVLNSVLGGGMSSRLFQEIREKRGLAYSVFSYTSEVDDAGKWVIGAGVETGKATDAIEACLAELCKLRDEGITAEELQRVKEQVKGGMLLGLEDSWSVAARNGAHILRYNQVHPVEQFVAEIEAVTEEDVARVARRLIRDEALHLALIGPYGDRQQFQDLLHL